MFYNRQFHEKKSLPSILPFKEKIPKNIILLIGDGMGLGHISAAMTANKGQMNLEHFPHIGLMKTRASDEFITDSAAAATAMATGHKTRNGALGVNEKGKPIVNFREIASKNGKKSGLLVCCPVTEATPGAYVAHQPDRMLHEAIAEEFLDSGIDFFMGEGRRYFDERDDGVDLTLHLAKKGYQIVYSPSELDTIPSGKIAGLLDSVPSIGDGRGNYLTESFHHACRYLEHENGFFLLGESSQIDWGAHDNDPVYTIEEILDFDKLVGEALEFAVGNMETLLIVTSDHETGGMTVLDGCDRSGKVEAAFSTFMHTGELVPVFSFGPGAEMFQGIFDNTDLFRRMIEAAGFSLPKSLSIPSYS